MKQINKKIAIISKNDNVGVALEDLHKNKVIVNDNFEIEILENISFGHKIALKDFKKEENIIKYGYIIGKATQKIKKGELVHSHNLKTKLDDILNYNYSENLSMKIDKKHYIANKNYFYGYLREDGRAGTRNDLWIVPTVSCVNSTAKKLEEIAKKKWAKKFDNIIALTHNSGCSQLDDNLEITQNILKGIIKHPNAGGVLVLSLGCENNNLNVFKPKLGKINSNRIKFLKTQEVNDEYREGEKLLKKLANYAGELKREKLPISKLVIGFKCGGSDAFSGITANPLCGEISDRLVYNGGKTILTEVPEMFGAENILMRRAKNKDVFNNIVNLINDFKLYFKKYNQKIYENPSPGNKEGGITTLEEKSIGCIQKGGKSSVNDVLDYGEQIQKQGLNLLNGPGNDPTSCTNLLASGANMILFTTGRGNPFGAPIPTLKISSNSQLYKNKPHWIDYDAGKLLNNENSRLCLDELWNLVINISSGDEKANNEKYGYQNISIFKDGVVL